MQYTGRQSRTCPATYPVIYSAQKETHSPIHLTQQLHSLEPKKRNLENGLHVLERRSKIVYKQSGTNSAVLII